MSCQYRRRATPSSRAIRSQYPGNRNVPKAHLIHKAMDRLPSDAMGIVASFLNGSGRADLLRWCCALPRVWGLFVRDALRRSLLLPSGLIMVTGDGALATVYWARCILRHPLMTEEEAMHLAKHTLGRSRRLASSTWSETCEAHLSGICWHCHCRTRSRPLLAPLREHPRLCVGCRGIYCASVRDVLRATSYLAGSTVIRRFGPRINTDPGYFWFWKTECRRRAIRLGVWRHKRSFVDV